MFYQKSLVLIKPDGVRRRLVGEILSRFEHAGFKVHAMKLVQATRETAEAHYGEHRDKKFYEGIVRYLVSAPVIAMVIGGQKGIGRIRMIVGSTAPADATPGSIRGDYGHVPMGGDFEVCNLIHASANEGDAARELELWFSEDEIVEYDTCDDAYHGHAHFHD
jgi:nucleoside-diphosphate kinase